MPLHITSVFAGIAADKVTWAVVLASAVAIG